MGGAEGYRLACNYQDALGANERFVMIFATPVSYR